MRRARICPFARTHRPDASFNRLGASNAGLFSVACIANTHGFDYDRDSRRLRTAAKARRAMSIMAAI